MYPSATKRSPLSQGPPSTEWSSGRIVEVELQLRLTTMDKWNRVCASIQTNQIGVSRVEKIRWFVSSSNPLQVNFFSPGVGTDLIRLIRGPVLPL